YAKIVDLEKITSRITTPFGTVKHYATVRVVDRDVQEAIPGIVTGANIRIVSQNATGTFGLVPAGDEEYAHPVITDTATSAQYILQLPDQFGTVVQIRKNVPTYHFEQIPLTFGRPMGANGEMGIGQFPLYMVYFDKEDKKE
ncbi:MAG: hypothetical protein NTZ55_00565, partial [Candidatus Roizmanbacteria bacterium]|nr:hypothetical protein [Candidatus Roizmanbacteria bacterium]